jgi:T5SS/PEP-CTERM-associated repeat protein
MPSPNTIPHPRKAVCLAVAGLISFVSYPHADAATRTWTGASTTNSLWNDSANWIGGSPINGDDLVFQGSSRLSTTSLRRTISSITFAEGAGAFNLGGTNAVTMTGNVTNKSNNLQTISMPLAVTANQTWDGGVKGLNVVGAVSIGGAALTLTNKTNINTTQLSTIGNTVTASLTVQGGSTIRSSTGSIGAGTNGSGRVTVNGAGSSWNSTSGFSVGVGGRGVLDVTNGGVVSGTSTTVGVSRTGTGELRVDGASSKFTNSSSLKVGDGGTGLMLVQNGGQVESLSGSIGSATGGNGVVRVTGDRSKWKVYQTITVGKVGTGALAIEQGGAVFSDRAEIGADLLGIPDAASVVVSGPSSRWENTYHLIVGMERNGVLRIEDGGFVKSGTGVIRSNATGVSSVKVAGAGSKWENTTLTVGSGAWGGVLDVTSGAAVTAKDAYVGYGRFGGGNPVPTPFGVATIDGTGSSLVTDNTLSVGVDGVGVLKILNGGTVRTGTLSVGVDGRVQIHDGQISALNTNLSKGTIQSTGDINLSNLGNISGSGAVVGKLTGGADKVISASGGNLSLGNSSVAGAYAFEGELRVGASQVELLSADQAFLGASTTLAAGGQLASSNGMSLGAGRALSFNGDSTVVGNFSNHGAVVGDGGTLAFSGDVSGAGSYSGNVAFKAAFNPGNSPASVSFNGGNATFETGSVLNLEVFGPVAGAQYDQLVNINTLTFNGSLNLIFANDYVPLAGSSFALFGFNTFAGNLTADNITVTGYDRRRLDFSRLAANGSVSVTAVPEPETYAMLLAGLGLMGALARRRRRAAMV